VVGPFGLQIMVIPSELDQRPRQTTQIMIGNAEVLHMGEANTEESAEEPAAPPAAGEPTSTPVAAEPTAVAVAPDIITLIMSRQDALVLKYSLEVGADIDLALRSAYDNDVDDTRPRVSRSNTSSNSITWRNRPKLPIGHDPSLDVIVNPTGISNRV